MIEADWIRQKALETGFSDCGIARCRRLHEREENLVSWLAEGNHAGLSYLERNLDKRLDPSLLVENAQSVIVCLVSYNNGTWKESCRPLPDPQTPWKPAPRIASYALARDYHQTIKEMLFSLLGTIRQRYPEVSGRCFTDTAPLLEKSWATEAGLGWIGKNSLLVSPRFGSFVLLGEIVIDVPMDHYATPFPEERCGNCRRCLDACPNGAIVAPCRLDLRKCISRLTIERPTCTEAISSSSSHSTGPGLHGWLFGCDLCQSVCPHNQHAPLYTLPAFAPLFRPEEMTRETWLTLSPETFGTRMGSTPLVRCGLENLQQRLARDAREK